MSRKDQRQFLQRELIQMEHFRDLSAGHPLMEPQFAQRAESIKGELERLPVGPSEPRTILFFAGKPVSGSEAIDAQFAANALIPFLEMVKSQYAASKHGRVGERGPRRDEEEARLMITGMPRGSFGLELSPPQSDDLFAEERLSEVLLQLARLIQSAGESDEGFLLNLDEIADRAFLKLPLFLQVLKDEEADLRMQTGDIEVVLAHEGVRRAFERASASRSSERQIEMQGRFRGAMLDTWKFDFWPEAAEPITGRIGPDLEEDQVIEMLKHANEPSTAVMNEVTTVAPGGARRRKFILLALNT